MRGITACTLGLLIALSGCSGGDDDNGGGDATTGPGGGASTTGPGGGATTTSPPGGGPGGNGTMETLRCTAQVGATGSAQVNNGIGGCVMTTGVESDVVVLALNLAGGCVSWYDSTPGDAQTEGEAEVGSDYPEGTAFGVYCDATMAPNSESTMDVMPV